MSREVIRRAFKIATTVMIQEIIENLQRKRKDWRRGRIWVRKWIARRLNLGPFGTQNRTKERRSSTFCTFFIILNMRHVCTQMYWWKNWRKRSENLCFSLQWTVFIYARSALLPARRMEKLDGNKLFDISCTMKTLTPPVKVIILAI